MSKEAFHSLHADTARLIISGALLAPADERLANSRAQLSPLSTRMPVLTKVIDQIELLQQSNGRNCARQLFNLGVIANQLRVTQLETAKIDGELQALPAHEKIPTLIPSDDVIRIVRAIKKSGESSRQVIREAIKKSYLLDLRLLPHWLAVIEGPADEITKLIVKEVIPGLGKAVLPMLIADFNIRGGSSDLWRLGLIAKIGGKEIKDLLLESVQNGSQLMRQDAISLLAEIDLDTAAEIAHHWLAVEKNHSLRYSALMVMAKSISDRALETIINEFLTTGQLNHGLEKVFAAARHPRFTEKTLELLLDEIKNERTYRALLLVTALGDRRDKSALPQLLKLWQPGEGSLRYRELAQAIINIDDKDALKVLAADLFSEEYLAQQMAIDAIFQMLPQDTYDLLAPAFEPDRFKFDKGIYLVGYLMNMVTSYLTSGKKVDPRWIDRCQHLVDNYEIFRPLLKHPDLAISITNLFGATITIINNYHNDPAHAVLRGLLEKIGEGDDKHINQFIYLFSRISNLDTAIIVREWAGQQQLDRHNINSMNLYFQRVGVTLLT
jgi:hypothetical protein